jgi:hypothetical protein
LVDDFRRGNERIPRSTAPFLSHGTLLRVAYVNGIGGY